MADNLNEGTIRDYLAANLDFIETGLTLIKKEHYLDNLMGASGSVDILAKDMFNNYVVIEIKRSQQASRQTIQELFKYIALLKQNYHARDSDIRCIIVSTHWGELLIPFSELRYQTTLDIKGLKIVIDDKFKPVSAEVIQPLSVNSLQRKFAKTYWFDLYSTVEKRDAGISILQQKCVNFGLSDFVVVAMDALRAAERGVLYPYAACFAFQAQLKEVYLEMLRESEHLDMETEEFETEDELESYLENVLLTVVLQGRYADSGEIGSPEKLDSELTRENWAVADVYKYGSFADDPRYDRELLLNELKGLDGSNVVKFLNVCDSTHQDRLSEIRTNSQMTVQNNKNWASHIEQIFAYLQQLQRPYRLIVHIYSPSSVFDSIIRTLAGTDYDYLPTYQIFADFSDTTELMLFEGYMVWNGKDVDPQKIIAFFKDEKNVFTSKFIDSMMGLNNAKLLKMLQLGWQHRLTHFKNSELAGDFPFSFKNGVIKSLGLGPKSFAKWIADHYDLKDFLLKLAAMEVYGYR